MKYAVTIESKGALVVDARFAPGPTRALALEDGMAPFVSNLEIDGAPVTAPHWDDSKLLAPECADGCEVRYRFDLDGAAERADDADTAVKFAFTVVSPPSTWLLRPADPPPGGHFEMKVITEKPMDFAFGDAASDGVYLGSIDDLDATPYAAIGRFRRARLEGAEESIDLVIAGPEPDLGDAAILGWAHEALLNLRTFYPEYPRNHALVIVLVRPGDGIGQGTAMGNGGSSIQVTFGQATTADEVHDDWILTHEMFHLAFPGLSRDHHWAEEGMATYLEPIARARRGVIPIEAVWREWYRSMQFGEPEEGDEGLDKTRTWGRTYWGGALFWFQTDVGIRKETLSAKGAPDFFAAIYKDADIADRWPMSKVVETADDTTATKVVSSIYAANAERPVRVDLDALFHDLGVSLQHGRIVFDDTAPLASVRKAMVVGPPG